MSEIASLSVGVDGNLSGFERAIGRATGLLTQFEARGARAGRSFDDGFGASVTRTTQRVGNSIDQLNNRIALLSQRRNLSLDTSVIARTNQEIAGLQARVNQLQGAGLPGPSSGAVSGLLSYAGGILSIGAAFRLLGKGFSVIQDFDRLDRKLQGATNSQEAYQRGISITRSLADRYGLSIESLSNSYAGLTASSEGTSLAGKETDRVFAAVTARAAKLGLSADQTEGSLLAVAQMMSKGTVSAEELRGQLGERMPGAFNAMARSLGVTTAELGKMLESGSVLAEDALPKLATELLRMSAGAEANANSISGGFQRAGDQLSLFIAGFSKTAGIDSFFAKFANGFADLFANLNKAKAQTGSYFGTVQSFDSGFQGKLDSFQNLDTPQRQRAFDRNRRSLRSNETAQQIILNGPDPYSEESTRELKRLEAEKRDLLIKQREFQKIARADAVSSNNPKAGVALDPAKYLDALKKRQEVLEKERAGLAAQGKLLDAKKAAELASVNAQLKRAEAPKQVKETLAKDTYLSAYDLLTRKLTELKKQAIDLDLADKVVPDDLLKQIDGLSNKLERANGLFTKLKKIGDVPELAVRGGDPKAGRYQSSNPQATRLINADSQLTKDGLVNTKLLDVDRVVKALYEGNKKLLDAKEETRRLLAQSRAQLGYDSANMLAGIGEAIGKGENPLKSALDAILDLLGGYLIQLGTALLLSSAALLAAAPLTFGLTLTPGLGQQLAGAGLIIGGGVVKGLASGFADGGHVVGPGSGTSDSIPAMLSNGEYVLRAAAVRQIGVSNLNLLNRGQLTQRALGGVVGYTPSFQSAPTANVPVERFRNLGNDQVSGKIQVEVTGKIRGNDNELQAARTSRQKALFG